MDTGRTIVMFEMPMAVRDAIAGCTRTITESGPAQKRVGRQTGAVTIFGPRLAAAREQARPRAYRRL
jgi:hypothetical protein